MKAIVLMVGALLAPFICADDNGEYLIVNKELNFADIEKGEITWN